MDANKQNQWLPPLPEPEAYRHRYETSPAWSYTAEQMRAYALEAIRAHNDSNARPLREVLCTPTNAGESAKLMASVS